MFTPISQRLQIFLNGYEMQILFFLFVNFYLGVLVFRYIYFVSSWRIFRWYYRADLREERSLEIDRKLN